MARKNTPLIMTIFLCFCTLSSGNATELDECKKKINDLAERGKNAAGERGLKGVLDKAQIGSLRTSGDKSSLKTCGQTLEKLTKLVHLVEKKVETEKK